MLLKKKLPYQKTKIVFFIFLAGLILLVFLNYYNSSTAENNNVLYYGSINTFVDGYDVIEVNLWSDISAQRKLLGSLKNRESVKVISEIEDYYFVESVANKELRGYCKKGFVILDN